MFFKGYNNTSLLAWSTGPCSPSSLIFIILHHILVAPEHQPAWSPHSYNILAKCPTFNLLPAQGDSSAQPLSTLSLAWLNLFLHLCFSSNFTPSGRLPSTPPFLLGSPILCSHNSLYISQSLPCLQCIIICSWSVTLSKVSSPWGQDSVSYLSLNPSTQPKVEINWN